MSAADRQAMVVGEGGGGSAQDNGV